MKNKINTLRGSYKEILSCIVILRCAMGQANEIEYDQILDLIDILIEKMEGNAIEFDNIIDELVFNYKKIEG